MNADSQRNQATQQAWFLTTRWSLVVSATQGDPAANGDHALEELCRIYWRPLYAFARRQGMVPAEAEDATQGFFARLLARQDLTQANPERGRFRTFLITSFKNFLANQRRDANRLKRGGGEPLLSLDFANAELGLGPTVDNSITPDRMFDRQWAETLLEQAAERFKEHYRALGKARQAEILLPLLWMGREESEGEDLAVRLEVSAGAARVLLYRARTRFRELVRAEIADTVQSEADVDAELRNLIDVLRGD